MSWYEQEQQKAMDQMNQDLYDGVWNAKPLNIWESIVSGTPYIRNLPSLFEVMNFDKIITDNLNDTQLQTTV